MKKFMKKVLKHALDCAQSAWMDTLQEAINTESLYGHAAAESLYTEASALRVKLMRLCRIAGV